MSTLETHYQMICQLEKRLFVTEEMLVDMRKVMIRLARYNRFIDDSEGADELFSMIYPCDEGYDR